MSNQIKVLLLEGDQAVAIPLATALREKGCDVVFAGDAVTAVGVARRSNPDVVVLSSELPGGGGLVALKRIRTCVHTAVIPAIAIGTNSQEQDFLAAGAQEFFERSADAVQLCSTIRRHAAGTLTDVEAPPDAIQEPERMAALNNTGLLDSAPETSFDKLTELASKLLRTPVALMSLVDKDRQFFKSQIGLDEPLSQARQTPLSHSFCQWVVAGKADLAVSDAREHPVLRNNLAIRDLGVVAYAGVPIRADKEQAIGSFCAVDSKPRPWSEEDMKILRDLADIVEAHIILNRAKRDSSADIPTPAILMEAAGKAIAGATRILARPAPALGEAERRDLEKIVDTEGQALLRLASKVAAGDPVLVKTA